MISHNDVRRVAESLPGAYEQASFGGRPSWRTTPRMFAWIREDPEALVVWVSSEDEKAAMIASEPARFFTTAHYDGTPILLVRLEAVDVIEASELVTESWRLRAPRTLVKSWEAAHRRRLSKGSQPARGSTFGHRASVPKRSYTGR